ncbi:MAG: LytTR family transcriptional regulator DNA-binding domain-containing protein [Chitinophagaceae bacterium]|jgi:DNA-binding LytR/AlgR family response regulator|nr:LytTR family transcriptional regulator DNA-binding domain-containing protein [Chitinophagaceae bacterium]MBP6047418.1 LytTR family transcriptional regulator DNA-binding domain-containing protein [Ferruginibacter sp.]MBK7087898.1 LytTR family transcriptional regulator DNA-binding domain-containing protein [Chitinophagaceae bacterium]MBK7346652.1 LytTR family transcriptional regulator DNA-binding domain-containing protein [Chitinophagaceae bacterium]MBK7735429.1 LytTR family transcriptional re
MGIPAKILVVEDEMVIGANISLELTNMGFEVTGIVPRGEEALHHIKQNPPDIVLLDIQLKGKIDGIETAQIMQKEFNIPVIYLTANADNFNFNRAKITHPYAFISKPYKKLDLQRAIELTVLQIQAEKTPQKTNGGNEVLAYILSDYLFVRNNDKLVKVEIKDIFYIEAERNYCRIYSKDKEYLLVMTLKEMDEKLPQKHFIRVHRSFIVNLSKIDEISTSHIVIGKTAIPVSKALKEELLNRLQTL